MIGRKCMEDEKPCESCDFGIMYMCKFVDGEKLWVCDFCNAEEKIEEVKTND